MKAAKVWKSVGVVALGLILITGGITGGFFIGKNNVETNLTGGDHVEISDGVGGAVIGEIHTSNAISLSTVVLAEEEYEDYGVSALAETAYTITVTPTPADAVDTFEWTSSDSSSVTVSPSNNGKTCTVSCLKAFSTQITLTCTSTHSSDVSATVTVDYVKRLSSVNVTLAPTSATFGESVTSHTFTATPVWGTGTITPMNFTISGGTLKNNLIGLTTTLCRTWPSTNGGLTTYCYRDLTTRSLTFTGTTFSLTTPDAAFVSGSTTRKAGDGFSKYPTEASVRTAYNNSFVTAAQNTTNDGTLRIDYSYSYGDIVSVTSSVSIDVEFDISGLVLYASDITVDSPELIV